MNAILAPVLEHADAAARFAAFLKSGESQLRTRFCIAEKAAFSKNPETSAVTWPEVDLT